MREQDIEISSSSAEGAVNYVIAKRFDNGGMRWIKERAEALLPIRCIEINGDWDEFISLVHDATRSQAQSMKENLFLKKKERFHYWRLMLWTLMCKPRLFSVVITLSIYGHHYRRVCELHILQ